jgi:hypothetical protein
VWVCGNFRWSAEGDKPAPSHAASRTEIDDVIGVAYRFFVVLDHNDGVAFCLQAVECVEQHSVIARVKADSGLV